MTANTRKQGYVLLGLTLIGTMATVIALTLASTTLNSRVARADATLLAVGKRVVEMNAGTENLQRIETLLSGVEAGGLEALQTRLEQKLDASVAELRKAIAVPPERNAKADEQRMQALLGGLSNQIRNLETQNQLQSRSIARLTEQLGAARQDVAALTRTTSNLETQLQQERSRIAPVAAPPQARPRERRDGPPAGDYIQYPDPQMKKLEIRQ